MNFKIKDLNDEYKVTIFRTNVLGGKTSAAEQKVGKIKKRILKVKLISDQNKAKISPTIIFNPSTEKMNNVKSEKYKFTPNKTGKKLARKSKIQNRIQF